MTAYSETILDDEPKTLFHPSDLALLDMKKCPKHIAIIMDGNRRWAKLKKMPPIMGHWEGAEVLTDIVKAAAEMGVKTLTVYAFSTENWKRTQEEIDALMNIFELYLLRKRELMVRDGIHLDAIGDLSRMPQSVQTAFLQTKQATQHCDRINLVLALNYGGRDDIRRAFIKMLREHNENPLQEGDVTESYISRHLDTHPWGDPDLLIRTSGEMRISNFLLWQISYSEIYAPDVLWPDFSPKHLLEACLAFQRRTRRYGAGI